MRGQGKPQVNQEEGVSSEHGTQPQMGSHSPVDLKIKGKLTSLSQSDLEGWQQGIIQWEETLQVHSENH